MPKKTTASDVADAENAAEQELMQLLQDADNFGLVLEETQFRALSDENRAVMVSWVNARRGGHSEAVVPPGLVEFASQELKDQLEARVAEQQARRVAKFPCGFKKVGWDDLDEGARALKFPIRVDEKYMGDRTAREVFGDKHVMVEMSRRQLGEWDQNEIVPDGRNRIIRFECDITRYSWCDGHYQFLVRCDEEMFSDEHALEEAATWSGKPGSMRITVLGDYKGPKDDAGSVAPEPAAAKQAAPAEPKKRGRPKKNPDPATVAKRPDAPAPLGQSEYNLAMTDKYMVTLKVAEIEEGRFAAEWSGPTPAGVSFTQMEPSVRQSIAQAATASVGNAIDYWLKYPDDEQVKEVLASLRHWLKQLDAGKTPQEIESEES